MVDPENLTGRTAFHWCFFLYLFYCSLPHIHPQQAAAENNVQHKEKRAANNQASAIVEKIAEKGMVFAGSVVEKLKNSEGQLITFLLIFHLHF